MYLKKIEGTWFLMNRGEFVESYETQAEAALALFDRIRKWESLYDTEKRNRSSKSSEAL